VDDTLDSNSAESQTEQADANGAGESAGGGEPTASQCDTNLTTARADVASLDQRLDRLEDACRPKPRPHIPGIGQMIGD
jgi:hypothetical protein